MSRRAAPKAISAAVRSTEGTPVSTAGPLPRANFAMRSMEDT